MPDLKDYLLQKVNNDGSISLVTKSYESISLIEMGKILIETHGVTEMRVIDNTGAVLWQGKSTLKNEDASVLDE